MTVREKIIYAILKFKLKRDEVLEVYSYGIKDVNVIYMIIRYLKLPIKKRPNRFKWHKVAKAYLEGEKDPQWLRIKTTASSHMIRKITETIDAIHKIQELILREKEDEN